MSAEATVAVFEHAIGSDAEWRMLAVLANAANPSGIVAGLSMAKLAELMDKTERGTGQVKRRLIESGQLVVLDEGGGRGRAATYWIKLPGLPGPDPDHRMLGPDGTPKDPVKPRDEKPGKETDSADDGERRSRTRTSLTSSSSAEDRVRTFCVELKDAEVSEEMQRDAGALLRERRKVGSRIVTPTEMAAAASALAAFNRLYEWKGREGSDYSLGAHLTSIVMRVRDHPSWDPAKHVRLVESAWRLRWWEKVGSKKRPTPNVIYGAKAFEQVVQDAKEEAAGGKDRPTRKYTRKNRG